jgi:hypothetical protein
MRRMAQALSIVATPLWRSCDVQMGDGAGIGAASRAESGLFAMKARRGAARAAQRPQEDRSRKLARCRQGNAQRAP